MAAYTMQQVVALLFLIVCVLHYGASLHCYSCTAGPDEMCDDQFSFEAHKIIPVMSCEHSPHLYIPGAGPNTHCGKTKKFNKKPSVENKDYVFRGCVPENYCRLVKNEVSECEICETEKCNSSSTIFPNLIFTLSSLLLVQLFFKYLSLEISGCKP